MDGLQPLAAETAIAYQMYVDYALMGSTRTVPRVAAQHGKHIRWCERLSSKHQWRQRAQRYDYAVATARAERLAAQGVKE